VFYKAVFVGVLLTSLKTILAQETD